MRTGEYPLFYVFHFYLFGIIAVASALAFVTRKSPVAAALWLVNTMFSLAALYVLLDAHFIGAIQVLVYAGAIMVVFLFVIMLLNLTRASTDLRGSGSIGATVVIIGLLLIELRERCAGDASLEQQRMPRPIMRQQPDCAVAVPGAQRIGLVLALPMRELELEDGVPAISEPDCHGGRCLSGGERPAESQIPFLCELAKQPRRLPLFCRHRAEHRLSPSGWDPSV